MNTLARRAPWLLLAAASAAAAWLVASSALGDRLEHAFTDAGANLLRQQIDSDIVIVGIDAKSLARLQQWPWPRRYHAELLEAIAPAVPRRVFVDIDFSSRSNPHDDGRLAQALSDWPHAPVILPAFYQRSVQSDDAVVLTKPLPQLRRRATLASVNLLPGTDGLVRTVQQRWAANDSSLPAVAALLNGLGGEDSADIWIDYTLDPSSFRYISYSDVIARKVPAEYFANKLVFVGATAIELGDMVPVPVYRALPGVAVQALAYESARDGLHEHLPASVYWSLLALWAAALCYWFCRQSWRRNIVMACAALVAVTSASVFAYALLDTILPVAPFLVAAFAAYVMATLKSLEAASLRALFYAMGFRKRDALLKSIVQSSSDSIVCIDARGVVKTANPAANALFARNSGTLAGTSLLRYVPTLLLDASGERSLDLEDLTASVIERIATTDDGDDFPVELSISHVQLDDELLYTAIVRDISERKAQEHQLRFQATHDPLTSLPNRPALAAHLDSLLAGRKPEQRVALLMIDLNRFKEVNDTLGHNVGDHVLHEVARRFAEIAKHRGFIARIGGDEFALVVKDVTDVTSLATLSTDLVDCLKTPIATSGIAIDVGLSIGIALCPDDATDAETLLKHSDVAMYVAKQRSSGFEFYDSASDLHSVRKLAIVSKLRMAIANDELQLHYQPQVNLASGRVESVEALLRWEDEALGFVSPDEFITLAETTDLIRPLSTWTLVQAFGQAVRWRAEGLNLRVAINLSARLLQDVDFPAHIANLIASSGVNTGDIELEITESAMMIDPERALRVVGELNELGALISIDDFGTGYSSLAYLRDLPVHALKLDKSFVTNLQQHGDDRVIVASTVQMAHALNLQVVAEGVETADVAALLRNLGYDYAQGYLYSKAIPADAVADWVRSFNTPSLAVSAR